MGYYSSFNHMVDEQMTIPRMELNKMVPEAMSAATLLGFGPGGEPSVLATAKEDIEALGLSPDDFICGTTFNPEQMIVLGRIFRYIEFLNRLREDLNDARDARLAHINRELSNGR